MAFVAGGALLLFLILKAGFAPIAQALAALGFAGLGIIALMHLPVIALLGLSWWSIGRDAAGAAIHKFVWGRLVRDAAAEVLPFSQVGGYVIGARAASLAGVDGFATVLSTVVDLVIELAAKIPYVMIGLALLSVLEPSSELFKPVLAGLGGSIGLLALVAASRKRTARILEGLADRIAERWPALGLGDRQKLHAVFASIFENYHRIGVSFALHVTGWIIGAFEAWITFGLMGIHLSVAEAMVIDSLFVGLRTAAFFVPGAIGLQEAGYILLAGLFGIEPNVAVAFSFARRARDFLIGVPALFVWQAVEGRRALFAPNSPGSK